ncbi:redox-regulated ATPase YchF [Candidatus Parcubacteria bacterium]|nr:MAG: redox-regulated ATPase YchF [Candidatus Parcubacteria bacterium]
MGLSIGIVGLPNVGKSTLFNALTKKRAEASNYPFCTIDPNVGVVKVPDARLKKIAAVSQSAKIIPTTIEFVDIAGLVKGAHQGEGLGNQFLAHIRECDAICEVVRGFEDTNIVHVDGKVNPNRDKETIDLELIFADLQTTKKALAKTSKEAKSGDKEKMKFKELLEKIKRELEQFKPLRQIALTKEERQLIKPLNLLTQKPLLYVLNTKKPEQTVLSAEKEKVVELDVKLEQEIAALPEEEQAEYIKELGLKESGLDKLIKASYSLLDLITFFTAGPKETRAWTVKRGALAPQAAGVIHSDFEKGFIRAEVINWHTLVEAGGEAAAKERGLIRTEGREYQIQDGDVCHFLFKV